MLSKREAKGSADGAGEGDARERVAAEEAEIGGSVGSGASLLVWEGFGKLGGNY